MENLAHKLQVLIYKNNRAFIEKVNALIVFYKYQTDRDRDFSERIDTKMLEVVTDLTNSLREFKTPMFFDVTYSKKELAWIEVVKLQKNLFYDFQQDMMDITMEGDTDLNRLEKMDNLAIDMIDKIEKKIKFYNNLEL